MNQYTEMSQEIYVYRDKFAPAGQFIHLLADYPIYSCHNILQHFVWQLSPIYHLKISK